MDAMTNTEGEEKQSQKKYIRVDEVMELCGVSKSHAYRIMRKLNEELKKKGTFIVPGRLSRKYFEERFYL